MLRDLTFTLDREFRLDKNENPFELPPSPREEMRKLISGVDLNRYPDPYATKLRGKLSAKLNFPQERIVIGNGGDEILSMLFMAYVKPGDRVLTTYPCFSEYSRLCKIFGAEQHLLPLNFNDNEVTLDIEQLLDAISRVSPKLILLDNPHNPTGMFIDPARLIEAAKLSCCPFVLDEAYVEFASKSSLDVMNEEMPSNLCVLRTLSKAWGLAGLRVGYALCSQMIANDLLEIKSPFNVNVISQEIACTMLEYDEWMKSRVYSIRFLRDKFIEEVNEIESFYAYPSQGNFVLIRTELNKDYVCASLKERGIRVNMLELDIKDYTWMRVSIGKEDELNYVIQTFRSMVRQPNAEFVIA